ncbi:MAG: hypothetical protein AAF959_07615 [Cyanobacteria bacterium P01_D01_bin.56]
MTPLRVPILLAACDCAALAPGLESLDAVLDLALALRNLPALPLFL